MLESPHQSQSCKPLSASECVGLYGRSSLALRYLRYLKFDAPTSGCGFSLATLAAAA